MSVKVLKADGSYEFFKVEKLRRSLRRSGATPSEVKEITEKVKQRLFEGIRTQQIYRYAFELLRHSEASAATRYSLRRALFGLGPTGFPFEKFIARMYEAHGYKVETNLTIRGKCVEHEIDVAGYNDNHSFVAEAKFHSRPGMKTDLQVALYSYARLVDLRDKQICETAICGIKEFRLITNTKFTSSAEAYAACVGLPLLSWDYPKNDNLHDQIQKARIYPITVIRSLNAKQVATLFAHEVIICRDLIEKKHVLNYLHLSKAKQESVINEAKEVLGLD